MEVQTTIKNDAITPCLVKITPAKRKANKKYYETHKESVIEYVKEYNYNRRQNDNTYREKINSYYKSKYDDEAKQKKREYYLKRKQQTQTQ
jgi:hypothetical protein